MPISHNTMRQLRRWHLYLGVFFAPAIFFFALSGAVQTFRLQEEKGWGGPPPKWMVYMAAVHKDSMLPREGAEKKKPRPPAGDAGKPQAPRPAPPFKLPMQIFMVLMSIGLMVSALTGALIALYSRPTRRISMIMLVAGVVVPIVLLMF